MLWFICYLKIYGSNFSECEWLHVVVVQGLAGEIGPPGQQGNPGAEVPYQHNAVSHEKAVLWAANIQLLSHFFGICDSLESFLVGHWKLLDRLNARRAHFPAALHAAATTLDFKRVSDFSCVSESSYKVMHTLLIILPYTELQWQLCSSLKLIGVMFLSRGCQVLRVALDYQEKR